MQRWPARVTISRALAYLGLVGLVILFLWLTLRVDLVIFGGVLFAISLRRAAETLSRLTRLPVGWSLLAVVLLILAFFSAVGWFFSQAIASQIQQLSEQLPAAAHKVGTMISQSSIGQTLMQHVNTGPVQTSPAGVLQSVFGVAVNVVEVVGGVIVIVFLTLYFAAEAGRYAGGLVRLVPPAHRARAAEVLHETANAIWYWMLGRLFSMTVLGIMTAVGLWLLGVPLPVALGFLAGIMIFVPYLGSIASAIPSVVIAASIDLTLAAYVIALYLGVHVVEGYILVPLVQRRVVHLPPALTLSAQIILGVLAGFLGLLFATPLVAAGLVLVRMIYIEGVLGDRGTGDPARSESGCPDGAL
ncbi:MAG: AI-2E family transporter, partial [Alphaproteobacteria bacterium]|nr:AI-2E family transporter [Alphaproteobacteria bacterium]